MRVSALTESPSSKRRKARTALDETNKQRKEALSKHQPTARAAFLVLAGLLLYINTLIYTTTHLDLLLNTQAKVLWSLIELPRRWVFGVATFLLVIVQYEALSLHIRLSRQYQSWAENQSSSPKKRLSESLWLHGSLNSDLYGGQAIGKIFPVAANLILFGVMWAAPVVSLVLVQATVMPVHSEWLSGIVRLSLVCSCVLILHSVRALRYSRSTNADSKPGTGENPSVNPDAGRHFKVDAKLAAATSIVVPSLFLSFHVFLWPGEWVLKIQSAVAPDFTVWSPDSPSTTSHQYFMGLHCWRPYPLMPLEHRLDYGRSALSSPQGQQEPGSLAETTSDVFDVMTLVEYEHRCAEDDSATMISTQLLRQSFASVSRRFSPTYLLQGQIVNGQNLTAQERGQLTNKVRS